MAQRFKILVGYDGGAHSDAALDDLKWAGLPAETDALIVSVGESPFIQPLASHQLIEKAFVGERVASIVEHANEQAFEALAHARESAARAYDQLSAILPHWSIRALAVGGQPAEELLSQARHWDADLIVVGSHGHSALGRLFLGSVSLQVAREAHCSVRIGRGGELTGHELRNLVGIDDSPAGDRAARSALARDWPEGARVRIVSVGRSGRSQPWEETGSPDNFYPDDLAKSTGQVRHWSTARGVKFEATTHTGQLERALADEAARWDADCIFLGWNQSLVSSQGIFSSNLLANAQCSVEVIR